MATGVTGDGIVEGAGVSNSMVYVGGHSRRIIRYAHSRQPGGSAPSLAYWVGSHSAPSTKARTQLRGSGDGSTRTHNTTDSRAVTEPEEEPEIAVPEPTDYTAAVAYLDENKIWARADMGNHTRTRRPIRRHQQL